MFTYHIVKNFTQLIKLSPKCQIKFESIQKQKERRAITVGIGKPYRWTVRTGGMQEIITN